MERSLKLSAPEDFEDLTLVDRPDRDRYLHEIEARMIPIRARAWALYLGFGVLLVTIVFGLVAFTVLSGEKLETNTLRELLQTTIAGEIGLIAGLLSDRDR
jgi:hypothetical protein